MPLDINLLRQDAANIEGEFNVQMTIPQPAPAPAIVVTVAPGIERVERELLDMGGQLMRTLEVLLTAIEAEAKGYEPKPEQDVLIGGKKYKIDDVNPDLEGTHFILNLRRNFTNT